MDYVEHTRTENRIQHAGSRVSFHESEDYLVQQAIAGDAAAFATLYDICVDRVYKHVFYRVSSHADAEDITQECFTRAWKAIGRYKKTGAPFVAWLIAISDRLAVDHYRKRRKLVQQDAEYFEPLEGSSLDPADQVEMDFEAGVVRKAVMRLGGDKQRVVLMYFIDGLSHREIARHLSKSEGTVRVIQYRALADLRRMLAGEQRQ
jgi:RNA polymerase sigma-70 factor, ECF subfamily